MILKAWGVKLKSGIPIHLANWDTIEDLDETDILPESNYFYDHSYSEIHHSFIRSVLNAIDTSIEFKGYPCCSTDVMMKVACSLNTYIKNNDCDIYTWFDEGRNRSLVRKEVYDLCEYINKLNKNGFVMWFQ